MKNSLTEQHSMGNALMSLSRRNNPPSAWLSGKRSTVCLDLIEETVKMRLKLTILWIETKCWTQNSVPYNTLKIQWSMDIDMQPAIVLTDIYVCLILTSGNNKSNIDLNIKQICLWTLYKDTI